MTVFIEYALRDATGTDHVFLLPRGTHALLALQVC
eukprot:COSAG06_NODE_4358_length_4332_cov_1.458540_1_plen_34_part_10